MLIFTIHWGLTDEANMTNLEDVLQRKFTKSAFYCIYL